MERNEKMENIQMNRKPEAPMHDMAVASFILGIIGLVSCGICGILAIIFAKKAENGGNREDMQKAGYIMGIISTVMLGISLLVVITVVFFAGLLSVC